MLASVKELYDWDLAGAERGYQRAIELNPNYAPAHNRYALLLARTGRAQAALDAARTARALDPLSLDTNVGLGQRLITAGKPKEALQQMLSAIELDRNYYDSHVHLANVYERLGSFAEAVAAAERAVELSGRNAHALHTLAAIHVRQKQYGKAQPLIAELETRSIQRNPYEMAMLQLEMNQADRALVWLERACEERTPAMAFLKMAQEGRRFAIVRRHPRFARILQCVERKAA